MILWERITYYGNDTTNFSYGKRYWISMNVEYNDKNVKSTIYSNSGEIDLGDIFYDIRRKAIGFLETNIGRVKLEGWLKGNEWEVYPYGSYAINIKEREKFIEEHKSLFDSEEQLDRFVLQNLPDYSYIEGRFSRFDKLKECYIKGFKYDESYSFCGKKFIDVSRFQYLFGISLDRALKITDSIDRYEGLTEKEKSKLKRMIFPQSLLLAEDMSKELGDVLDLNIDTSGYVLSWKVVDCLKFVNNSYVCSKKDDSTMYVLNSIIPSGQLMSKDDKIEWIKKHKKEIIKSCLLATASNEYIGKSLKLDIDYKLLYDIMNNINEYYYVTNPGILLTGQDKNIIKINVGKRLSK